MITAVPAFWMKHPNFGDALTPYLIRKITGKDAIWTNQERDAKYMITGSLLNDPIVESCIVWGAGVAFSDTFIRKPLQICAVRGPRSRHIIKSFGHECPEIYGDPCLLLPRFYKGQPGPKTFKLGIIPHIIDYTRVKLKYHESPDIQVIDLLQGVEDVINRILECDVLISSSLHGIIAAHAYGKPCMWVKFSNDILGDGTKYRDYLMSIGHEIYEPLDLSQDVKRTDDIMSRIPTNTIINANLDALWEACPLK